MSVSCYIYISFVRQYWKKSSGLFIILVKWSSEVPHLLGKHSVPVSSWVCSQGQESVQVLNPRTKLLRDQRAADQTPPMSIMRNQGGVTSWSEQITNNTRRCQAPYNGYALFRKIFLFTLALVSVLRLHVRECRLKTYLILIWLLAICVLRVANDNIGFDAKDRRLASCIPTMLLIGNQDAHQRLDRGDEYLYDIDTYWQNFKELNSSVWVTNTIYVNWAVKVFFLIYQIYHS